MIANHCMNKKNIESILLSGGSGSVTDDSSSQAAGSFISSR